MKVCKRGTFFRDYNNPKIMIKNKIKAAKNYSEGGTTVKIIHNKTEFDLTI